MARPIRTLYYILEVEPSASQEEIHQAYLRRIKQVSNSKNAERLTQQVNRAYEVLSDSAYRARYDQELADRGVSAEGASSSWRDASRRADPRTQEEKPRPSVTTSYPIECARCGQRKPRGFKFCPKCYAIVQTESSSPIRATSRIARGHRRRTLPMPRPLAAIPGRQNIRMPGMCEHKPANYALCRLCNAQSGRQPGSHARNHRPDGNSPRQQTSNTRRPYEYRDGAGRREGPKTRDTGSIGRITASATTAATGIFTTNSRWST